MTQNINVEFNLRTLSGCTLDELTTKSGLSTKNMLSMAMSLYKRVQQSVGPDFELAALNDDNTYAPLETVSSAVHVKNVKANLSINQKHIDRIQAEIGPIDNVLTESLFVYDQTLDAKAAGKAIGIIDHKSPKITELHF